MRKKFIPVSDVVLNGNEKKYVMDCLDTSWISSNGRYVDEFEMKFSRFCSTKYAVSCCNGTAALHLALLAHGTGPGDEVIMPTLSYIATANSVRYCGARPVFVDSDPGTGNLDPRLVEEKITPRTRGIIAVHLYGHPADMDPLLAIARDHNLFVIEDAAEAHGARYKDKTVGSLGDCGAFSFYGNKIVTTGEGGMVVTGNRSLAGTIRTLKGQGVDPDRRYWHTVVGYNYRMTNIEAAIGLAQLENIDEHLQKRREIADLYFLHLENLSDYLRLPVEMSWARHAFWMYTIQINDSVTLSRDDFAALLLDEGIETRPVFYPIHRLPPYLDPEAQFPVAEKIASRGLNLPTHGNLSEEDIVFIAGILKNLCNNHHGRRHGV